jgi:hypothetical protein
LKITRINGVDFDQLWVNPPQVSEIVVKSIPDERLIATKFTLFFPEDINSLSSHPGALAQFVLYTIQFFALVTITRSLRLVA